MIKKFSKYTINEKMGISDDGEILSEYLISKLKDAESEKTYIFIRNGDADSTINKNKNFIFYYDLPTLQKNVYKVIVNYQEDKDMTGIMAFFDPKSSKYTKNGHILYFTFMKPPNRNNIWKHYIYHEIHHGIQYLNIGKNKMSYNPKNLKVHYIKNFKKSKLIELFINCLYFSINFEQGALIPQFYGKMKHKKNIKSVDDLRKYFEEGNIYEYRIAYQLKYIDLIELLKDKNNNESNDMLILFFSLFKLIGNIISKFKTTEELENYLQNVDFSKDIKIINNDEMLSILKNYTKYFNKIGDKLSKKLDKTYQLLLNYYEGKFKI